MVGIEGKVQAERIGLPKGFKGPDKEGLVIFRVCRWLLAGFEPKRMLAPGSCQPSAFLATHPWYSCILLCLLGHTKPRWSVGPSASTHQRDCHRRSVLQISYIPCHARHVHDLTACLLTRARRGKQNFSGIVKRLCPTSFFGMYACMLILSYSPWRRELILIASAQAGSRRCWPVAG